MEKDWMYLTNRISSEYKNGVDNFISFAKENAMKKGEDPESIPCPCKCCKNLRRESSRTLRDHLIVNGMDLTYHTFVLHGEEPKDGFVGRSETYNLCRSAYMSNDHTPSSEDDGNNAEFKTFVETAEAPLFLGCTKYTKLSAVAVLYKHKAVSGWSDKSFHKLLEIFHDMLPDDNKLPDSFYVVKKMLKEFGMDEVKIDACVNDCVLYHKDLKNEESCPKCHSSRWKVDPQTKKIRKNVPAKVLRYFPIIPRFKRMYASPEKAELLRWHSNNMSRDGCMRHLVDSFAWDRIKKLWPAFHDDPRNLRLALAADGINPYRDLSSTYSIWPVMLVTYNLSPWMCLKKEHIMLALLIPGPKQPGNDIDVYLEPLIDDLLLLWDTGVVIYDAFTKMPFRLRAILMWTVSDYPAYGNLCGCTTKGRKACAVCGDKTVAKWLKFSWKFAFLGNRRFLEEDHIFRFKAAWFDGHFEFGSKPPVLSGTRIYEQVKDIENDWGKGESQNKRKTLVGMWKKNSGFFKLPYWKVITNLLLRSYNSNISYIIPRKNGEPSNDEVADKMRKLHEIRDTQPDISSADLKNDAVSQVFGDEYRGRVRVYGFGVSPSDVGLISQNQEVILQLGKQVTELTQKVSDVDALKQEMQQHINEKREMQEQLKNMQQLLSQLMQSQANTPYLPATTTITPQTSYEGINCKLFRMDKDDIVAEGRWVTDDLKTKVHGRELGNNASKVWVTKAIEPLAKVWRTTNGIETMEEAEGSTIAWPTDHVIKDGTEK